MVRLFPEPLDPSHAVALAGWQAGVDGAGGYAMRVGEAKAEFSRRNTVSNTTFRHIKTKLTVMCCGARRCAYCEDSVADEVEHMRPKDLYPNEVFAWENYVYACGPCNGPKNNQFAVLAGTPLVVVEVGRARNTPVVPPLVGSFALLDPRVEDPLDFLFLDLANTFAILPKLDLNDAERLRAAYTVRVLRLNERDYLIDSRKNAFRNYRARLREYIAARNRGEDVSAYRAEVAQMDHRTVWQEMKRQHALHPALAALFATAPEALGW
jgi:hypothetical protein